MYATWTYVAFYNYEIDFQKQMTTVLVLPKKYLMQKFIQGLHGYILN